MSLRFHKSFSEIPADAWDALAQNDSPFVESDYLFPMESLDLAIPRTGWKAMPISFWSEDELRGAIPLWAKAHSMGEFVYDQGWADAVQRAGSHYYPKLIAAIPFTPVSGGRLLGKDEKTIIKLLDGLDVASEGFASANLLFPEDKYREFLEERGFFERTQFQFWFYNEGFTSFDEFLASLKSSKRKMIRRERKALSDLTFRWVNEPNEDELRQMHQFYCGTCEAHGPWGRVYLSEDYFVSLATQWKNRVRLLQAIDGETVIAAAFYVEKDDRLYGRYWGTTSDRSFLHFEVCYYQAIDYCIEHDLKIFEPGHGGEHKYRRGFRPTITRSWHRFNEPRLQTAFTDVCAEERAWVARRVEELKRK